MRPLAALTLLVLLACKEDAADSGSGPTSEAWDTAAVDWASLSCEEAPIVTWNNFGQGFTTHFCQGCHASTSAERFGAPPTVSFDSAAEVWAQRDRVLARSAVDPPTMPPAGGISDQDRQKLRWWLECAEEGT